MTAQSHFDPKQSQVWLVGGGVASMAAAVFLIRDAGMPGANIHILEELGLGGGSLDGSQSPTIPGAYVTRGGRMLAGCYDALWNLLDSIPSLGDPKISVRQEIVAFNQQVKTDAHARLVDRNHRIVDASVYGFSRRDRLQMTRLLATPERRLGARRIDEMFSEHFFSTNFWQMWRTTFAFQNWHSAIELKRYMLRFIQEFPRMHTLSGVNRTKYNQYDSIARPLQRWLLAKGVNVRFGTRVVDADFDQTDPNDRRVTALQVLTRDGKRSITLGRDDIAMFTLGSIAADAGFGDNDHAPETIRDRREGSWALWSAIAGKAADFGNPFRFCNVDENKWESFTLTMHGRALLDRIVKFSGNEPGTGALMTFFQSKWLMSIVVPYQPHFPDMPPDTYTLWGYGLFLDVDGDYVGKPMSQCTGREILQELIGQLGFDEARDEILATTDVTPVMLPYASAMFAPRVVEDRPLVLPEGARNFAFLGQWVELPEDVVYTVEYSVHCAMHAVYALFGVDKEIPPIYHGLSDPKAGLGVLQSAYR